MLERLIQVLVICLPVFACILLGRHLMTKGQMSHEAHRFINGLVYRFSLPALIFRGVSKQEFSTLIDPGIITSTVGATIALGILGFAITRLIPMRRSLRAPATFAPYWANLSYLGFPLAQAAFGDEGFEKAAIVNAFTMPVMVVSGIILMSIDGKADDERIGLGTRIRTALTNPVVLASALGIGVALANDLTGIGLHLTATDRVLHWHLLAGLIDTADGLLSLIGAMGLPLALVAVGGSLVMKTETSAVSSTSDNALLWIMSGAKLIIAPLATLLILSLFPDTSPAARGAAVLLMATPAAVAAYMIAGEMSDEHSFVARHLVLSTMLGCVSIPCWVYFLL
ncbi:MAG: AEC family transporter [Planctomycetota bacterium]|jgi:predicted permease|nr:AEC family transporter [Planctomycetota bacterium]